MKWYGVEFKQDIEACDKYEEKGVLLPKIALFRSILKADGILNEATQCYNNTLLRVYLNEADLQSYNNIIDLIYDIDVVQSVPNEEAIKYGYNFRITIYYKEYGVYTGLFKNTADIWNKAVEFVLSLQDSKVKSSIDKACSYV